MILGDKTEDIDQRLRVLFGLQSLYVVQAKYEKVESAYAQAEKLFTQTQSVRPPFVGLHLAGAKLFMGRMAEAKELFDRIVTKRDYNHIRDLQESHGMNYLVHGLAWNAHAIWCLGHPQSALDKAEAAAEFARERQQPFSQALAITYLTMLHVWRSNADDLMAYAEDARRLTLEYDAPYYHAWSNILWCFAQAERQADAENLDRLHDAIQAYIATGARTRLPVYFAWLAQVRLKAGRWEEGADALDRALSESHRNNEHWWDAEIHRLRAEWMLGQGDNPADAEAAYRRALEIARFQQARSLELRAATGLARLMRSQSREEEAKRCLTQIYDEFMEGFDTPDLQIAQALIAQL
jgi:adenylate cyclase